MGALSPSNPRPGPSLPFSIPYRAMHTRASPTISSATWRFHATWFPCSDSSCRPLLLSASLVVPPPPLPLLDSPAFRQPCSALQPAARAVTLPPRLLWGPLPFSLMPPRAPSLPFSIAYAAVRTRAPPTLQEYRNCERGSAVSRSMLQLGPVWPPPARSSWQLAIRCPGA